MVAFECCVFCVPVRRQIVLPDIDTHSNLSYCVNVEAWRTSAGSRVWATVCAASEEVQHELNRVWVHHGGNSTVGDHLYNPASKLCADAPAGKYVRISATARGSTMHTRKRLTSQHNGRITVPGHRSQPARFLND